MSFLDSLKAAANRGLDVFRDVPTVSVNPNAAAASGIAQNTPAAVALSAYKPAMIEAADLTAGRIVADEWSTLGSFKVSRGTAYKVPAGRIFRMYLRDQVAIAGANGAGGAATVNVPNLVDTRQGNPAFPTKYHPDVQVWCKVAGVWALADVTAINYATGDVTYTEPAACTNVEAYGITSEGEWRVRVYRELGATGTQGEDIMNGSFGSVHLVDQASGETAHRTPRDVNLVNGSRLALEVKKSGGIALNDRAGHVFMLDAWVREIAETDPAKLRRIMEAEVRQGI